MPPAVDWDPKLYAINTGHHRDYDDHVLGVIAIEADWRILDIGCGAADLTARLASMVPDGAVLGIDSSTALIEASRERWSGVPNLAFEERAAQEIGSISTIGLPGGGVVGPPFDLVISTATLHWVPGRDHRAIYRAVRAVLRPGGWFRADFGGAGQIADTRAVLDAESARLGGASTPWYFPTAEVVAADLESAGLSSDGGFVRLVAQERSVPDVAALVEWLDSQVLIAYRPSIPSAAYAAFRERSIARLAEVCRRDDGSYDQHYIRLDLLTHNPD